MAIEKVSKRGDGSWVVLVNSKSYSVDDIGLFVIQRICACEDCEDICKQVHQKFGVVVSNVFIEDMRSRLGRGKNSKGRYIKFQVKLLKLDNWGGLLGGLSALFHPWIIFIFTSALFTCLFLYKDYWLLASNELLREVLRTPIILAVYSVLSLLVLLIHELGHASAAHKYGVLPESIGFGIYICFPVLYTDVTSSWLANRNQRLMIDCGGFYFQAILLVIAIPLSVLAELPKELISIFVWDNLIIIAYNLNPLFRFDGYWILSDLYNISNLRTKANQGLVELYQRVKTKELNLTGWQHPVIVYIYGLLSNVFLFFVWGSILWVLTRRIESFLGGENFNREVDFLAILKIAFLLLMAIFSTRSVFGVMSRFFCKEKV